jgi:hypothetical protein
VFLSIRSIGFSKKSKFEKLRNRPANMGQKLLLKVSSNFGWREYISSKEGVSLIHVVTFRKQIIRHVFLNYIPLL